MDFRLAGYPDAETIIQFDPIASADRTRANIIHQKISSRNCHVAVVDRQVVGYGVLDYTFFNHGFIPLLYVAPEYRRRGVGCGLLRHLEEQCTTPKLFTTTNQSNEPMLALLAKLKYKKSGRIENIDDGDPEVVFLIRPRHMQR